MDMRRLMRLVEACYMVEMQTVEPTEPKTPADAFLDEVWSITHPHPFMRGQRLYGHASIELRLDINNRKSGITINDIMSLEAGERKGHGRAALRMLLDMADKHGVTLSLFPKAYAKGVGSQNFPKTPALRDWYLHYGFAKKRGDDYWYRKPGTPVPQPRAQTQE